MRNYPLALVSLLALVTAAHGEMTPEEAQRRMQNISGRAVSTAPSPKVETPKVETPTLTLRDDAPDNVKAYYNRVLQTKAKEIEQLTTRLRGPVPRHTGLYGDDEFGYFESRAAYIAKCNKRTKELSDPLFFPTLNITEGGGYQVGTIGAIKPHHFKVLQVIDKSNFVASVIYQNQVNYTDGRTYQRGESRDEPVWVSGFDTTGFVDGQIVLDEKMIQITGTKQYNSLAGVKTVLLIQPCDVNSYLIKNAKE